jgi:Radical SAM superfamily
MYIYPISSLKNCDFSSLNKTENSTKKNSCLFWRNVFNTENVMDLLDFSSNFDVDKSLPKSITHFINSPNIENELKNLIKNITRIGIENKVFFETIEIINYLLNLFSEYYYNNFTFTIDNAFDIDVNSIEQVVELAQNASFNPYYSFLETHFVPSLKKQTPEIVFVNGRPSLFNFSQLYFIKKIYPQAYIFISNHSSEYYSLNKITEQLKSNEILFSWVDGIILDDFKHTEYLLRKTIKTKATFLNVPNLLLKTSNGIKQTNFAPRKRDFSEIIIPDLAIEFDNQTQIKSPFEIFETKLLINNQCHWSSCSYCGINAKYPTKINSRNNDISSFIKIFNQVKDKKYKLLVLQDEAIPVDIANKIAIEKHKNKNNLAWHYRSKISLDYSSEIISSLAKSNLKGIYFGLESVNKRIIELMNKYEKFIEIDFIESLVDMLFKNNIHCHFCVIIGFPTETREEIQETLDFISKIKKKHSEFTFTINIFESDIASPVFKKNMFNLNGETPVPNHLYIGNKLNFDRNIPYEELTNIKLNFLKKNISNFNSNITEIFENPNSLIHYINSYKKLTTPMVRPFIGGLGISK